MLRLALAVLWLLGLSGCGAAMGPGLVVPALPLYAAGSNPLLPTHSYDAHIRNLLLSGKVAEALGYAKEHYGRVPAWLRSYAAAFDAAKQAVGQCQDVAKAIHAGMTQMGQKPEYLGIQSTWRYVLYQPPDGKEQTITRTGYHVVVKVGDRVFDAYTGPAGMKVTEYLSRLSTRPNHSISTSVVNSP